MATHIATSKLWSAKKRIRRLRLRDAWHCHREVLAIWLQYCVSSRPVAIANRIVSWTACMFGVHFAPSDGDFPPR
ncbi:Uncharacterized protein HZ326_23837 [Fusarium oxysporum f. sp. albedinis]|nr:Uncharacterized protein HZ326_23837 [Fusarium oxysporum f. sp. albedinis]